MVALRWGVALLRILNNIGKYKTYWSTSSYLLHFLTSWFRERAKVSRIGQDTSQPEISSEYEPLIKLDEDQNVVLQPTPRPHYGMPSFWLHQSNIIGSMEKASSQRFIYAYGHCVPNPNFKDSKAEEPVVPNFSSHFDQHDDQASQSSSEDSI